MIKYLLKNIKKLPVIIFYNKQVTEIGGILLAE